MHGNHNKERNMNAVVSFEDSVKQRLKAIVADLIPEEKWDGIVQATVREFERTDLPKLVREELTAQYKAAIAAEFAKPEWQSRWNNVGLEASPNLQKMLIDAAPMMLASMIGGSMQSVIQQLQYNLQNNRGY
jgi:hypothetical protein